MADDLLAQLDERLGACRLTPAPLRKAREDAAFAAAASAPRQRSALRDRLPWVEAFIAIQFLWGAVLFLPGSQAYRPVVRALPYASSLALLAVYLPTIIRMRAPRGTILLLLALVLLALNLLHPTSQMMAGVAQCIFQASIAAPMFWGWKSVGNPERLHRLLWIALLCNVLGAGLGVLQVHYPEKFMPAQLNSLGTRLNDAYVESLTYIGPNGERIVRPPGLSDQPGGAAPTGALAVVLGAGLSVNARSPLSAAVTLTSVGVGLAAIYLTQVRSMFLMSIGALGVLAFLLLRRGQVMVATRIAVTALVLVVGSFVWARSLGGESVEQRFVGIAQQGALQSYQEHRGGFVSQTFGELLDQYPFGAGVGRWGMMYVYFGDAGAVESQQIHVEIQPTGWLLDGGLPMWALYGGAILVALLASYRLAVQHLSGELARVALVVIAVQVLVVGFAWAGPVFNTQVGVLFWFLTSALYGAVRGAAVVDAVRQDEPVNAGVS